MGGTEKFPSDMVVVPYLVTIVREEWFVADLAGGRDSEANLGVDVPDESFVVEVDRERLLLQVEHLLGESLQTVLAHITLVIALEFGDEGDHLEAHRARRLRLVIKRLMTARGVVEVRRLDQRLEVRVDHHGDQRTEPNIKDNQQECIISSRRSMINDQNPKVRIKVKHTQCSGTEPFPKAPEPQRSAQAHPDLGNTTDAFCLPSPIGCGRGIDDTKTYCGVKNDRP